MKRPSLNSSILVTMFMRMCLVAIAAASTPSTSSSINTHFGQLFRPKNTKLPEKTKTTKQTLDLQDIVIIPAAIFLCLSMQNILTNFLMDLRLQALPKGKAKIIQEVCDRAIPLEKQGKLKTRFDPDLSINAYTFGDIDLPGGCGIAVTSG